MNKGVKIAALDIIKELGPVTSREVAEQLGISPHYGRVAVSYCRNTLKHPIYIAKYIREEVNGHLYPRPAYAYGDNVDVPKLRKLTLKRNANATLC